MAVTSNGDANTITGRTQKAARKFLASWDWDAYLSRYGERPTVEAVSAVLARAPG